MAVSEVSIPPFPFQRIRRKSKPIAERRHIMEIRVQLYERSGGLCELQVSPKCPRQISFLTMHTCHVVSRGRGGPWDLENLKAGCLECHIGWEHNGGKPCPPKNGGGL